MIRYWLMKTEPEVFSIEDLRREKTSPWEGIRNYQARNYLRDHVQKDDQVFIYHSNAKPTGIAGTAVVVKTAYADHTALDPKAPYYFPKATPENNPWVMVDVRYETRCREIITRDQLRETRGLENMVVLKNGRLSIQPVSPQEFKIITEKFSFYK